MKPAPAAVLSNGICITNFSSPHEFTFSDGRILPACDEQRSNQLSLDVREETYPSGCGRFVNVSLRISLSLEVIDELLTLEENEVVDIILVPLMCLDAIKSDEVLSRKITKARTVRMFDRVKKIACFDKFCV